MALELRTTFRGVVYPWQCDSMGHFNTRFYTEMFDDASLHLLYEVGHVLGERDGVNVGWADVKHEVTFLKELRAGDLVIIASRPVKIGIKSLQYLHEMKHAGTNEVHATMLATTVQFDLNARRAVPVVPVVRSRVLGWLGAIDQTER